MLYSILNDLLVKMDIKLLEIFKKYLDIFLIQKVVQAGNGYANYSTQEAEAEGW